MWHLLLLCVVVVAAAAARDEAVAPAPHATPAPIILLGLDGLKAGACDDSEGFKEILRNSSYTLRARTVEYTRSWEAWQAILKGGYTLGDSQQPDPHHPRLFEYIKSKRPHAKLWLFSSYYMVRTSVGAGFSDHYAYANPGSVAVDMFVQKVRENGGRAADLTVLYSQDIDKAGHSMGWESGAYKRTVEAATDQIRRLHQAAPDAIMFIVSDHGGEGYGHSFRRRNMNWDGSIDSPIYRDVPWIIYNGPERRPLCDDVRNEDTVAEVAKFMNLEPHPSWRTRAGWLPPGDCRSEEVKARNGARPCAEQDIRWCAVVFLVLGVLLVV